MAKIYTIAMNKGGCGKTSLLTNLVGSHIRSREG
jgi:cellulose biosynthesis protein BcsQ